MTKFPDLTVPGFLLDAGELDDFINRAQEMLDELGEDPRLVEFIEKASQLRAVHDKPVIGLPYGTH